MGVYCPRKDSAAVWRLIRYVVMASALWLQE